MPLWDRHSHMGSLSRLRMVMMVTQRPVHWTSLKAWLFNLTGRIQISPLSPIFGGKTPRVNALRFHIYCIYVGLCHGLKMLVMGYGHPSHGTDEKMPSLPGRKFPCGPGSETRGDIRGGVLSTNCHQLISELSHTRKPAAFGWKMVKIVKRSFLRSVPDEIVLTEDFKFTCDLCPLELQRIE